MYILEMAIVRGTLIVTNWRSPSSPHERGFGFCIIVLIFNLSFFFFSFSGQVNVVEQ